MSLLCAADVFIEQMTWKALAVLSLVVDLARKCAVYPLATKASSWTWQLRL